MTVAELIAKLQAMPQHLQVTIYNDEWMRAGPMPAPEVRTLYQCEKQATLDNLPYKFVSDEDWRSGEEVVGEPFDSVVLGLPEIRVP